MSATGFSSGRPVVGEPDDLAITAAIWVMSCNDESSLIPYYGLSYRLGIADADARRLVRSRPELFLPGVPPAWLDAWKQTLGGPGTSPGWYQAIPPESRAATLAGIRGADAFCNQFRAEQDSPRCSLDVLRWGVEHLELLRKAASESRRQRRDLWTHWIAPGAALLAALLVLAGSLAGPHWPAPVPVGMRVAAGSEERPPSSLAHPDALLADYAAFMIALDAIREAALGNDNDAFEKAQAKADRLFYRIEAFLRPDARGSLTYEYNWLIAMGRRLASRDIPIITEPSVDGYARQVDIFKRHIHDTLLGD